MDKRLLYAVLCIGCFLGAAILPGWIGTLMLIGMIVSFCLCLWHFLLVKQESLSSAQPLMMPTAAEIAAMKQAAEVKALEAKATQAQLTAQPIAEMPATAAAAPKPLEKIEPERPTTGRAVFNLGDEPPKKS